MQLDTVRYAMEWQLMRNTFPEFRAFARPPRFGWEGYLRGKRSGQLYAVVLTSTESTYPASRPKVFLTPRFGHHWLSDGSLCIDSLKSPWDPALHSFANTLVRVIEYMEANNA
jgi:ubiquitin-protein ligase